MANRSSEQVAMQCFRDAQSFLKVSEQIAKGGIEDHPDNNPLDPAFAPNAKLKKNDPLNVMSREWGDIGKVRRILNELNATPAATTYEELGWGLQQVNQARDLFPAVVERADKLAKTSK